MSCLRAAGNGVAVSPRCPISGFRFLIEGFWIANPPIQNPKIQNHQAGRVNENSFESEPSELCT